MRVRQISQSLLDEYLVYKVHNNQGDSETGSRSLFPSHLVTPAFEPQDWLYKTVDCTSQHQDKQADTIMGPVLKSTPTEYWLAKDSQRSAVTERVPDHPALSQWLHNPNQPASTKITESTKITKSEPSLMWLAAAIPNQTTDNNHQEWLSKSSDENSLWLTKSQQSQAELLNSCWLVNNSQEVNNQWMSNSTMSLDNSQWLSHGSSTSAPEPTTTLTQSIDMWLSDAMSSVDIHHEEEEVDSGLSEGAGSSIVVIEPEEEEDFEDFQEDDDMSRWLAI